MTMGEDELKNIEELLKAQQRLNEEKSKQLEKERQIKKEAQEALDYIKKEGRLRKDINGSFDSLYKSAKHYKNTLITISKTGDYIKDTEDKITELKKDNTEESLKQLDVEEAKLKLLKKQQKELITEANLYKDALKNSNKSALILGKSFSLVKDGFGKLKSLGLFEMDKAMKNAAFSMGVLSNQSGGFRKTITNASKQTASIGVTLEDISKIQETYSEELGRSVQMNEKSLIAMGQISKFAGLGAEGAAKMAADMDRQGISAEKTGQFINQTLDDTHAMGVNASKVIKNISGNIKMLNKYRFKDGIKGLEKMAITASKLGVDMEFAAGMSDKLWDVEGAVDMSAQLQVMGGAWAQMADPFHLMYMARNDMEGLTEEIANAAKQSMSFAKDGSIEMSAMEMHRLKIVAQQTGLEYDKLVEAGKTAFKLSKTKAQIGNVSPELQEFIANTAEFKDGKATIMVNGDKKLLSTLSQTDKNVLMNQMKQKEDMKERAKQALSFDEALTNMINGLKIYLLPFIDEINKHLLPAFNKLTDSWEKNKWGDKIESVAKTVGEFAVSAGKIILNLVDFLGPTSILATWAAFKIGTWIANGVALGRGFNMTAKVNTPSLPTSNNGLPTTSLAGKLAGKNVMGGKLAMGTGGSMLAGAGLGVAGMGVDLLRAQRQDPHDALGKGMGVGSAALKGAALGMMFGPWGALAGGLIGGGMGVYDEYFSKPQNDAVFSPRKGLGSEFSKGRGVLENGKITPIPNKERFLSMEPYGPADRAIHQKTKESSESMKVEHGDMNVKGSININLPGTNAIALEIMKTSAFRNEIVKIFNSQQELAKNQKPSG